MPCDTPPPWPALPALLLPVLVLASAQGGFCCNLSLGNGRAPLPPALPQQSLQGLPGLCRPPLHTQFLSSGKRSEFFMDQEKMQVPAERFRRAMLRVSALSSFILLSGVLLAWLRTGVCPGQRLPGQSSQGGLR